MSEPALRVLHWYPNFLGGGAVANVVLALALAQTRAGAAVHIAAADEGGRPVYGTMAGADEIVLPWTPTWRLRRGALVLRGVSSGFREQIRAFGPDVVHAHGEFNPDNFWATSIGGARSIAILSPQGAFDPGVFQKSRERRKRLYVKLARRVVYERLDAFHVLSPREDNQARVVAPGVRTYVVPQGGGPAATMRPTGRVPGPSPTKLVFVGRLDVFTKGLDLLLRALALMRRDVPDVHLTLVGPDSRGGRAQLEQLAFELGIVDVLTFTGTLPSEQVARVLDESDGVVLTSRHEGLSLAATEALIRGKPLIVSSETGHASYPEIAKAPSVLVVPPDSHAIAEALRSVCACRDELNQLAVREQPAFADLFSWDRVAARHLEMYEVLRSAR